MEKDSKGISPIRAIRAKCLECSNGSSNEVKLCPVKSCPLHSFRFGHNPNRLKRELTDEQRQALAERMRAVVNEQRRNKNRTPPEG